MAESLTIKAICKKPMQKVPKVGITSQEVEDMFLAFCEGDN